MLGDDPDPDPDPYLCMMDPDPGGPKTCGSGGSGPGFGSGSATLAQITQKGLVINKDIQRLPTTTPLLFSVAQEIFDCPQRDTLTQYITFKRGGERGVCTLVLCNLATVMSCIDASVHIVIKFPKVGSLLKFPISLVSLVITVKRTGVPYGLAR